MRHVLVLIHSPSVGPRTWQPAARSLGALRRPVIVPNLLRVTAAAGPPFWPAVVAAVRDALAEVPEDRPVILVTHSNGGLFVPVIRRGLRHPVAASVFVDAALPARSGDTPVAPAEFLPALRGLAGPDGLLPPWTDWWGEEDIAPLFPDAVTRAEVSAEQPRLPLSYYEQSVPVPAGWDDHSCAYLLFGPAYEAEAAEARARGWAVAHEPGAHLHQLVDPDAVARRIVELSSA